MKVHQGSDGPLPAALMGPWLEDNEKFVAEMDQRSSRLATNIVGLRQRLEPDIRQAGPAAPCPLSAVDAASVLVPFGDQVSILIQSVIVADDGATTLGIPRRITGIDGHEFRLAATPMRVAEECRVLAMATQPTIADTSYWSFLMEVNQAITRQANSSLPVFKEVTSSLVTDEHTFIDMIQNPFIVPMSKTSQSDSILSGVSDRHVLGEILRPGEYLAPRKLTDGTGGSFGIEKRLFTNSERNMLNDFFKTKLGVVFFKPHPWTRAFRLEGHLERLCDEAWLLPLLAAVSHHTEDARMVVEPWPQFMADYTARKISAVTRLYGSLNWHRHPEANYFRTRTR